jgi:hypothetical protein
MKKTLMSMVASFLLASIVNADSGLSLSYDSAPDFRGHEAEAEINAAIGIEKKVFGLDFGIEGSVGVRDNADDESRLSVYTSLDLSFLELEVGVVGYDNNIVLGDAVEVFVEAGAEITLNPTVTVYYEPDSQVTTVEGGVSQSFEVKDFGVEVSATVGNTEVFEDRENYYKFAALATYAVNEKTYAFVGVDVVQFADIDFEDFNAGLVVGISHKF